MERDQFLDRVRRSLATSILPTIPEAAAEPQERIEQDLVGQFVRSLTTAGGVPHRVGSAGEARQVVLGILDDISCRAVLSWTEDSLPVPGILDYLAAGGIEVGYGGSAGDDCFHRLNVLAEFKVGITGADMALAETGSIVLRTGPGRPRAASLLPEVHVALLPASRIVADLGTWMSTAELIGSSNVVVITGPSRTADIEQVLTLGVHGPRQLHVVLIDD